MKDFDGNDVEYRPLTREEQLQWLIGYLTDRKLEIETQLLEAKLEYLQLIESKLSEQKDSDISISETCKHLKVK